MALGNPLPLLLSTVGGYEIKKSLRFDRAAGAYLSRSVSYTPSSTKIGTWSFWVKRCNDSGEHNLFGSKNSGGSGATGLRLVVAGDGSYLNFFAKNTSNNWVWNMRTTQVFRDYSGWYHIVAALDTTQGTEANRIKIYVNGVQVTDFGTATYPGQNDVIQRWGQSGETETIGSEGTAECFDGYMSEIHYIDGQQLTASSFGETNEDTGQWVPIKYAGTYGNGGFYLKFLDNSGTTATTLGKDSSGNSGNFTPNNFSVAAGIGNDSFEDTPTNNFCTLNPLKVSSSDYFLNGNLDLSTSNAGDQWAASTFKIPETGKWFYECTLTSANNPYGGLIGTDMYTGIRVGYYHNGQKVIDTTWSSYGDTLTTNDVVGTAINRDDGEVTFYKNGTSQGTITSCFTAGKDYFVIGADGSSSAGDTYSFNFGQRAFAHSAPTGYKKLCTANLPEPTIKKGTDHFNTVLYTGNDSSNLNSITGVGFQPNLVWGKSRNDTIDHILFDSVRGDDKQLSSDNASVEVTRSNPAYRFISDGFQVATAGNLNNPVNYAAWCWKGGGAASSNSDGSITSSVSANPSAGFSIGTFTAQSSGSATVGHGLGVAPDMILTKSRTVVSNWYCYHQDIGQDGWILLDTNAAATTSNSAVWNPAPTSSVFTYGSGLVNQGDIVFYAFSGVEGYSKAGVYTGNGGTDGPMANTGFKPALVLIKSSSNAENWNLFDNTRDPDNYIHHLLVPNTTTEENSTTTARRLDFLSNGFKIRGSDGTINTNNYTYVYMAFAETPFKYANAR